MPRPSPRPLPCSPDDPPYICAQAQAHEDVSVIQYSLRCAQGHTYDAWFRNAAAFDEQATRGIVRCAVCNDGAVEKAPMAPSVARTDQRQVALSSDRPDASKIRELLRAYRQKVMSEADYVGDRFAEEARKIHFEEVDAHHIYGEATRDEAMALADEGIAFLPLPDLPEDRN